MAQIATPCNQVQRMPSKGEWSLHNTHPPAQSSIIHTTILLLTNSTAQDTQNHSTWRFEKQLPQNM